MTSKHILKPWALYENDDGYFITIDGITKIAEIYDTRYINIILAAPETAAERNSLKALNAELLEALQDLCCMIFGGTERNDRALDLIAESFGGSVADSWERARAVTAKAKETTP